MSVPPINPTPWADQRQSSNDDSGFAPLVKELQKANLIHDSQVSILVGFAFGSTEDKPIPYVSVYKNGSRNESTFLFGDGSLTLTAAQQILRILGPYISVDKYFTPAKKPSDPIKASEDSKSNSTENHRKEPPIKPEGEAQLTDQILNETIEEFADHEALNRPAKELSKPLSTQQKSNTAQDFNRSNPYSPQNQIQGQFSPQRDQRQSNLDPARSIQFQSSHPHQPNNDTAQEFFKKQQKEPILQNEIAHDGPLKPATQNISSIPLVPIPVAKPMPVSTSLHQQNTHPTRSQTPLRDVVATHSKRHSTNKQSSPPVYIHPLSPRSRAHNRKNEDSLFFNDDV